MKRLLIFSLFMMCFIVYAQRTCGTEKVMQEFFAKYPQEKASNESLRNFLLTNKPVQNGKKTVITVPVVVHVLYSSTAMNISDAQIYSQLAVLNADFRKLNSDFSSVVPAAFQSAAADLEIAFCLATKDPNNNPTTGIERKSVATNFNFNNNYYQASGLLAWDTTRYLNIWVGNMTGGYLGWAYQPGAVGYAFDGLAIGYRYFGNIGTATAPYNKGRTATHEIGHYFGLDHIWGSGNYPDVCGSATNTDNCADTPQTYNAYFGVPTYPDNTNMCTPTADGAMFMNYMDYVDDQAMAMFTNNQKTITTNALLGPRSALLGTNICTYMSVSEVEAVNNLIIFPNPASDYISVSAANIKVDEIEIFNTEGRLVKSAKIQNQATKVNITDLSVGTYFVRIYKNKDFLKSLKFIKK